MVINQQFSMSAVIKSFRSNLLKRAFIENQLTFISFTAYFGNRFSHRSGLIQEESKPNSLRQNSLFFPSLAVLIDAIL